MWNSALLGPSATLVREGVDAPIVPHFVKRVLSDLLAVSCHSDAAGTARTVSTGFAHPATPRPIHHSMRWVRVTSGKGSRRAAPAGVTGYRRTRVQTVGIAANRHSHAISTQTSERGYLECVGKRRGSTPSVPSIEATGNTTAGAASAWDRITDPDGIGRTARGPGRSRQAQTTTACGRNSTRFARRNSVRHATAGAR